MTTDSTNATNATNADYILNISVHVLILFTFLTIFFFVYVSKLSSDSINNALTDTIRTQMDTMLNKVDELDNKIKQYDIPWEDIDKMAIDISDKAQDDLPEIVANNKKLKWHSFYMIAFLFVVLLGIICYYKFYKKVDINLKYILVENLIFFIFIGIIEALFFIKIASKYIPVTPDFVSTTLLDRLKYNINS